MFNAVFILIWALGYSFEQSVTMAFTSAGNNFELALAVAIGSYGIDSPQAFAAVIGPLVEIPVMLCLIYTSSLYKGWLFPIEDSAGDADASSVAEAEEEKTADEDEVEMVSVTKEPEGRLTASNEWVEERCKPCPDGVSCRF